MEKEGAINTQSEQTSGSKHPQPIDYDLGFDDILHSDLGGYPNGLGRAPDGLEYKNTNLWNDIKNRLGTRKRENNRKVQAYHDAVRLHKLHLAAKHEAELRKRSYWLYLDGYAFEHATGEVLNKHGFNARVTQGSGDGGIDIEVTKNGLKGVVQCKAHVACAGPHVVRDLYGVIHHCGADFGIIVSRGGFTQGAHDFRARQADSVP